MDLLDIIKLVTSKPETWGGLAIGLGLGWWDCRQEKKRIAELSTETMKRFADHVLGGKDK